MLDRKPLAVDLDGSLVKTDMLHECVVRAVFSRPWLLFLIPLWLVKYGIARSKILLADTTDIDVSVLPYNAELLDWLRTEKAQGRTLVLCTGSAQSIAEKVANHLGIFDSVIATNGTINLTGKNKAEALLEKYGDRHFSYVGNEEKDLKVWQYADSAVLVANACHKSIENKLSDNCRVEAKFELDKLSFKVILKAMRIHQWSKNALLFVPLITAHKVTDFSLLFYCLIGFVSFGLMASATYLVNDLSDLDSDRNHWKKKNRPLAASALTIKQGLVLFSVLIFLTFALTLFLNLEFGLVLVCYVIITLMYSFWFKRLHTVDLVVLASLYTVRLFAGAAAISVMPSYWLLSFSMFIFLCLAIVKRISEIQKKQEKDPSINRLSGRGYYVSDLPVLTSLGSASGMVAIMVFATYVNSPEVIELYSTPMLLWGLCPIIGYWVIRVLIMTSRGEIDEDPISFAIRDRRSWIAGFLAMFVVFSAATFGIA